MKEVNWQSKICEKIRSEYGFAQKWATQLRAGPPDLIMRLPSRQIHTNKNDSSTFWAATGSAFLCEVKVERNWTGINARTPKLTAQQLRHLKDWKQAGGEAFVLWIIEPHGQYKYTRFLYVMVPMIANVMPPLTVKMVNSVTPLYHWKGVKSGENLSDWIIICRGQEENGY